MKLHSDMSQFESRFIFSRELYCYLTEQQSSCTETSLSLYFA